MTIEQCRDLTNNVFAHWGYSKDNSPQILENRVKLYNDFRITRAWRSGVIYSIPHTRGGYQHDHLEAYKTLLGRIVIFCSNYGGGEPAPWMFMKEHARLYSGATKTFLVYYESESDARLHLKAYDALARLHKAYENI